MKKAKFISIAVLLIVSFMFSFLMPVGADKATEVVMSTVQEEISQSEYDLITYDEWLAQIDSDWFAFDNITLNASNVTLLQGGTLDESTIKTDQDSLIRWDFEVVEAGFYNMMVTYTPIVSESGFGSSIQRSLIVNGNIPYQECQYLDFFRVFKNDGPITTDNNGDDIRPTQVEQPQELTELIRDSGGYEKNGLRLYLNKGTNRIELKGVRGEMLIKKIELGNFSHNDSYAVYSEKYAREPKENAGVATQIIESENTMEKSHSTIIESSDQSSANTTPSSYRNVKLNIIGGENWKTNGQWLKWEFEVAEDGLYKLGFRYKQNIYPGSVSYRRLYIDDKVPFAEAEYVGFQYCDDWKNMVFGGDTPYAIYLEKGKHTLTLQVCLGEMADTLKEIKKSLLVLNQDYLRLLTYTGASPDIYRNYHFEELVPDVLEDLKQQSQIITSVSERLKAQTNQMGENTVVLDRFTATLEKMNADTDEIARNFSNFKDGLASIGTWLTTYTEQPLALDKIILAPIDSNQIFSEKSFFSNLWFGIRRFFISFVKDYSSTSYNVGDSDEKELVVWTATGRDQREIIKRLVEDSFTRQNGIKVHVQLISADALMPNILTKTGPDVYLSAGSADPINYAIRGAIKNLNEFSDIEETIAKFHPESLVGFRYKSGLYALPESLSFPVLFYRKDIFAEFNVQPPETWSDFYELLAIFQQNNLSVGFSYSDALNIFLYQNGGRYYSDDLLSNDLISNVGIAAFRNAIDLYTTYGLPVQYDFSTRFRSGEMPMGICDYMTSNQLLVFAPEIQGMWGFVPVPGTERVDGSINHTVPIGGNATFILKESKYPNEAWEFLKWWTSVETQSRYGMEMETVVGPSSRQPAATLQAVKNLPWTEEQLTAIETQWKQLKGTPQIPGSYYVSRVFDFAFNDVYGMGVDPVETWERNLNILDQEIVRKSKEFEDSNIGQ